MKQFCEKGNIEIQITARGTRSDRQTGCGSGDDFIAGGAGSDTLKGGDGNDTILGQSGMTVAQRNKPDDSDAAHVPAGASVLTQGPGWSVYKAAGSSNITITGGNYDTSTDGDTIDAGAGDDIAVGSHGDDVVLAGTGDDMVWGAGGADIIEGGAGADILFGDGSLQSNLYQSTPADLHGADYIDGGAGEDQIFGGGAADQLFGGEGNDTISGDIIDLIGTADELAASYQGNDYIDAGAGDDLAYGDGGDDLIYGGTGKDTLFGDADVRALAAKDHGRNTLDGGTGTGNDTYWLGRGWGNDMIQQNDATAGNTDIARFDAGIATDQLWFQHVGNNLEVSIIGTTDKFTLSNWYTGSANHVEQFKTSNGKTLLDSQLQSLVSAMAAFSQPAAGQTTLPANYATTLAPVIAANWV